MLRRALLTSLAFSVGSVALAQAPFDGDMSSSEYDEVKNWGTAFWDRVENGTATNPIVQFNSSALNSPLFNPYYAARPTLERLKNLDPSDCFGTVITATSSDPTLWAKRAALRSAMMEHQFATDPVSNESGNTEHVTMILDNWFLETVAVYEEGGKLVTEGLPLDAVLGAGASSYAVAELSANTLNCVIALALQCPDYAVNAPNVTEAQKMQTGSLSRADALAASVRVLMDDMGHADLPVERYDMAFGVFGSLPLIVVGFDDAKVVIDAWSGVVAEPVAHGSSFQADALLAPYGLAAGNAVRLYSAAGCVAGSGPNTPPQRFPRPPAWPAAPQTPIAPSTTPGNPTGWTCVSVFTVGGASCVCTRTYTYVNPAPGGAYPATETCVGVGACIVFNTRPLPADCSWTY